MDYDLEITRRLDSYTSIAYEYYRKVFKPIKYDLKLRGRCAGKAWPQHISLNKELLEKYPHEILDQTLPHEIAHCIQRQIYGYSVKPHGKEWQFIMRLFGKKPDRCHSMQTTKVRHVKRYAYRCGCSVHMITSIKRNRIENGSSYFCVRCRGRLMIDL